MASYQLGPVIGQIGGAEVQKIPVDIVADGASGSEAFMHTLHVPEGETWLVALIGNLSARYTNINGPQLFIGEYSIGPSLPAGLVGVAAETTGTAVIRLKRNASHGADTFSGHVYTVPLPD